MTRCQLQNLLSGLPIFSMYSSLLQKNVGPAGYHRDHSSMENYLAYSAFLPYLNNEKHHALYNQNKRRFEDLNHLLMVKFMYDPIIYPIPWKAPFLAKLTRMAKRCPWKTLGYTKTIPLD